MPGPSVLAILVAHASRTRLTEALRSLGAQTYDNIEIVVATVGELNVADDVSATVIQVREGAGFGEAVTGVLDTVRVEGFDHVLLLHDDVSLEPDVVQRMVSTAASDPAIAAVGAKLLEWFEPSVLQEVGSAIDRFAIRRSALDQGEVDHGQRDETSDVLFCSDACLLVRRDALIEVGGLDAKASPFYEDVDLCWRLRAHGARVVVDTEARVRHAADMSSGRRLFDTSVLREYAERGRLRFMLKHYAPLGLAVLLPQLVVAALVRLLAAVVRRELWRVRVIVGAWAATLRDLPAIVGERRRAPKARVEDRELLALAARGAVGEVRGDRAEWASNVLATLGRFGERALAQARQPVTWVTVLAVLVVVVLLRRVVFGGEFSLGEIRPLAPLSNAISDHFGRVRREGLDPFAPAGPGLVVLGLIRSVVTRAALAEKLVLLLPLLIGGLAGARWGRSLGFGPMARRWLGAAAAVNPVTLSLLRDGALGALLTWAVSLWLASEVLVPSPPGEGLQARVRFTARWAFAWAITVALHPPALLWLLALGLVISISRRPYDEDDRTRHRLRILVTGALGAFVLLLPWSVEFLTLRSPLVGRPGWLVHSVGGGLERASLGGGWPLLAWLVVAVVAAFFVGLDRTTYAIAALAAVCILAGATGAFPRETMLAATGICAFLIVSIVVRHITDEISRYELGARQAALIAGVVALAALWAGGVVQTVPSGARLRTIPVVAGIDGDQTGRVLWLAETTSGVRTWSTLSFSDRLGAFPAPGGPESRLVTKAVEAARAGRTHRLGGLLALADISHIVSLDEQSRRGLVSQSDLGPLEEQGTATVFRNDAWRGPAILLSAAPDDPLSPSGLADVVRDPQRVAVDGWPYEPITIRGHTGRTNIGDVPSSAVVYFASGHRGGLRIEGTSARVAAAGAYVPAGDLAEGPVRLTPPGRWWRWMLPVAALLVLALLGAWLVAAYTGAPLVGAIQAAADVRPIAMKPLAAAFVPLLIVGAFAIGWVGLAWGVGTPFLSSAWYCPPIGAGFQQSIGIVNPSREHAEYLVRPALAAPPDRSNRISAGARHTVEIDPTKGAVIESYGRRLVVGTEVLRQGDRDASLCSSAARRLNVFPEGGRASTKAVPRLFERYILYNPFPDLARASVRFVATDEVISPPALQDVQVKPGTFVVVDPEEQFEPMLDLSTTVSVWQGRAIVARRLRTVEQVTWGLPVDEVKSGVVPRALTADGASSLLVVNRNEDPANIAISGAGRTGSLPEESFDVGASRRDDFELSSIAPRAKELVFSIRSDLPVAVETLVAPDDRRTVSLLPLMHPERRWVVPMAEERELVVTNAGTRRVTVQIGRLGRGADFDDVTIEPNRVRRIKLAGSNPFGVIVTSTGGVTVAAVGERGSIAGVPLP